jgi:hypothetical protein
VASLSLWSELVPYAELQRASLLAALAERGLGLFVAVTPEMVSELPDVVRRGQEAGVKMGVWPMLDHEHGRWPSAVNVARFAQLCEDLLDVFEGEGLRPHAFAIDLEPPIAEMPGLLAARPSTIASQLRRGLRRSVIRQFSELVEGIERRGIETLCASFPVVVSDALGIGGWQRLFGTPVDGPPFSWVSGMVYTSMIEGYSRGTLHRADCLALLGAAARAARRRYGERASVSLGAVGHGILGDEPTYRNPGELAEDVGAARAAGIDHLLLFSLGGVLARGPRDAWLDALAAPPASTQPRLTPRAVAAIAAATTASRAIDWGHRAASLIGAKF